MHDRHSTSESHSRSGIEAANTGYPYVPSLGAATRALECTAPASHYCCWPAATAAATLRVAATAIAATTAATAAAAAAAARQQLQCGGVAQEAGAVHHKGAHQCGHAAAVQRPLGLQLQRDAGEINTWSGRCREDVA